MRSESFRAQAVKPLTVASGMLPCKDMNHVKGPELNGSEFKAYGWARRSEGWYFDFARRE